MSARNLRKGRARAVAKTLNYDEANQGESDDELLQPPRKKATRVSTRLTEPSASVDTPEPLADALDDMQVDAELEPTRPSTNASGSATPSDAAGFDLSGPSKPSAARKVRLRLGKTKVPPVPTKDDDDDDDDDEGDNDEAEDDEIEPESEDADASASQSASASGAGASTRPSVPLTARQAAMAGLGSGEAQLLSLEQTELGRKKVSTKTAEEIEDKRREAAKRRKIQLEQKTKEEKEGAVDRLLNKQAPRPRAKRYMSGTGPVGTPTGYATPLKSSLRYGEVAEAETRSTSPDGERSASTDSGAPIVPAATTIRWVSTSRAAGRPLIEDTTDGVNSVTASGVEIGDVPAMAPPNSPRGETCPETSRGQGLADEPKELSFALSIPSDILAQLLPCTSASLPTYGSGTTSSLIVAPSHCAVAGCPATRKYRVVLGGGEEKGACGLDHFRILKGVIMA